MRARGRFAGFGRAPVHSRSKKPTKREAERRASALLRNTRSLDLVKPDDLARITGLPLPKAQAMWDAEALRRTNG